MKTLKLLGFLLVLGALAVPARAQSITIGFEGTNYVPLSFGRQLSFNIEPVFTGFSALSGSSLVVALPPGVSFVASTPTPPNITTVTSISGSSSTGEVVTLTISPGFSGGLLTNFLVIDNVLTMSVGNSVADGTILQATFDLSGTVSGTTTAVDSGPFSLNFQAGYRPVSVSVAGYGASCNGQVRNADFSTSNFNKSGNTGLPISGSLKSDLTVGGAVGGLAAIANGASEALSSLLPAANTLVKLGDITGPDSVVRLSGIGGSALAYGGYALFLQPVPPSSEIFTASNLVGIANCVQNGVTVTLSFSNPNPYTVPLVVDERSYAFLAVSDGAATNPFGFPGNASTQVGSSPFNDIGFNGLIGGGQATTTIFERALNTPSASTLEDVESITCFSEGQSICSSNPPSDTTVSVVGCALPGLGSGFGSGECGVPPGVTTSSLEFGATRIDASGSSNIATDAMTGGVTLVRSGYGTGSGAVSVRIYRGDANLPAVQAREPAKLVVSGSSAPIELTVTDPQGHRAGFQAAPSPPPRFLDAQPSILTEIFGASYSGISSQPQVISIPDPDPAPTGFTATVTGTGTGAFTLTMETLAINGSVIDSQSFSGTAASGSATNVNFTVQEDGTVSLVTPPSCAADVSSSVSVARSGFGYNFLTGRFVQGVTLKNTSGSAISGPVSLVLDSLSSNATLFNASGKTACAAPLGSPFVVPVASGSNLAAGASVTVYLQFTDPTKAGITYTTRVLAGSGSQ